jgi:hypothetical protein
LLLWRSMTVEQRDLRAGAEAIARELQRREASAGAEATVQGSSLSAGR